MGRNSHEFRDPIHGFIKCNSAERRVIDSKPVQRLRNIRQLAMSSFVYPGCVHTRFEHSLGVMELATRIFDQLFPLQLSDFVKHRFPWIVDDREHWRKVVRMAALCHDLGHTPFSHGAEAILPAGWKHEQMTWQIITHETMADYWSELHITAEEVARLALGQKELTEQKIQTNILDPLEDILSEIIVGNVFGADRMDYLLRDSYYAGVTYGHFEEKRLIDTLKILPSPNPGEDEGVFSGAPMIGIERGGVHAALSLIWARYSMFSQVYFHHVRRSYDMHLVDFLKEMTSDKKYPLDVEKYLSIDDTDIITALKSSAANSAKKGHEHAKRILNRNHFRKVCGLTRSELNACSSIGPDGAIDACDILWNEARKEFPKIKKDKANKGPGDFDCPVQYEDSTARTISILGIIPQIDAHLIATEAIILADSSEADRVSRWIDDNREDILKARGGAQ